MAKPTELLPGTLDLDGALARPGSYASAVAGFAVTAVLLAAFGIYGTVMSGPCRR